MSTTVFTATGNEALIECDKLYFNVDKMLIEAVIKQKFVLSLTKPNPFMFFLPFCNLLASPVGFLSLSLQGGQPSNMCETSEMQLWECEW